MEQKASLDGWAENRKSKLAKTLIEVINQHEHSCYVEVFAGAAHVFFKKQEAKTEIINDINSDIINLYRVLQNHLEEFCRYFKWALVSREEFERLGRVPADTLTDIQRACRFYYLQKCSFENLTWQQVLKKYDRPHTLFFLDPPYFECEDYYGKGLFKREEFEELAQRLQALQGSFVLSLNDKPQVRKIFAGFSFQKVKVQYSCATPAHRRAFDEVIITK